MTKKQLTDKQRLFGELYFIVKKRATELKQRKKEAQENEEAKTTKSERRMQI